MGEPLVWGLFRHAWKTENIQTVGAQPYLRRLARAISLPHSNRQSCNMNMQFYDHSGETHVHTRTSYAFRPRRTSPGLFGKLRTCGDAGAASAKYAGLYVVYVHCATSSMPRGKFRNSFLRECRVASRSFIRFSLNMNLMYVDSGSGKHRSPNVPRGRVRRPRARVRHSLQIISAKSSRKLWAARVCPPLIDLPWITKVPREFSASLSLAGWQRPVFRARPVSGSTILFKIVIFNDAWFRIESHGSRWQLQVHYLHYARSPPWRRW